MKQKKKNIGRSIAGERRNKIILISEKRLKKRINEEGRKAIKGIRSSVRKRNNTG